MQSPNKSNVLKVKTFLETTIQYPEQSWTWGVHQNPVDYSIIDPVERCSLEHVGPQLISFDDELGFLFLPGNESSVWDDVKLNMTGESQGRQVFIDLFESPQNLLALDRRQRSLGALTGLAQRRHQLSNLFYDNIEEVIHGAYSRGEVPRGCCGFDVFQVAQVGKLIQSGFVDLLESLSHPGLE